MSFSSSTPKLKDSVVGSLIHDPGNSSVSQEFEILLGEEIIIGRDKSKCRYVLEDAAISRKHLRIYTITYENDDLEEAIAMVYAEDVSTNGSYWNGSFMGRRKGGFLLSDNDTIRLNQQHSLVFKSRTQEREHVRFDLIQEKEMSSFSNKFIITDRLLGAGAFGRVFMAIDLSHRSQVACKIVDLRKLKRQAGLEIGRLQQPAPASDIDQKAQACKVKNWGMTQRGENIVEKKLEKYYREIEILSTIHHPNIIGVQKVYVTDNTIYMFQELITAGDLFSYIESKEGEVSEVDAAVIIRQITVALCFLHERNIVHRDLKPENILMTSLSEGCRIVLTDFGTSRRIVTSRYRMSTLVGTVQYAAPEALRNQSTATYTKSVDMWALGCTSVVLLTGGLAFKHPVTNQFSVNLALHCKLDSLKQSTEWNKIRARPKDFVERLLVLDEAVRMTAHQALGHHWFSNAMHKVDFQQQYDRAVSRWQPQSVDVPIINFMESKVIVNLPCSQAIVHERKLETKQKKVPVEAPYKPFPRHMYRDLWPTPNKNRWQMSQEVEAAVQSWSWPLLSGKTENDGQKICARNKTTPTGKHANVKARTIPTDFAEARSSCTTDEESFSFQTRLEPPSQKRRRPSIFDLATDDDNTEMNIKRARAPRFRQSTAEDQENLCCNMLDATIYNFSLHVSLFPPSDNYNEKANNLYMPR